MSESGDLIRELMGDLGMTQAEIARHLGRSPDMVRLVRLGRRPGHNLTAALRELRRTGHVSYENVPPRRRDSRGHLVPVRAPEAAWKARQADSDGEDDGDSEGGEETPQKRPTRLPRDPKDPTQQKARRNRYAVDRQVLPGGVRRIDLHSPKKPDAKGRQEAEDTILGELRSVTRSQSARNRINPETGQVRGGKVVKFYATTEKGQRIEIGSKNGYQSSTVLRDVKKAGSFFSWMDQEMRKGRPDSYVEKFKGQRLVNIEMTSYYQSEQQSGTGVHRRTSIHG